MTTQIAYLLLVKRNKKLHGRTFYLMAVNAVSDLLFGIYIMIVVGLLPLLTNEAVHGGQSACQAYGAWTAFMLSLSMSTLLMMAYERYRTICTPSDPLTDQGMIRLGWRALALCVVLNVTSAASSGSAVQPSGLYCNPDMRELDTAIL